MDCIDQEPGTGRTRDRVALALVAARAARGGLFDHLRRMPPATADRVAAALGWDLGPTRAILQALAAGGLVRHDPELSTWSLVGRPRSSHSMSPALRAARRGAAPQLVHRQAMSSQRLASNTHDAPTLCTNFGDTPLGGREGGDEETDGFADGGFGEVLDLAGALAGARLEPAPTIDRAAPGVFPDRILPAEPALRATLERGARVVGLPGSEGTLEWIARHYPRVELLRSDHASSLRPADLVLQLSPLVVPENPDRWLTGVARAVGPAGFLVLRALRRPLSPPVRGREWWHALAVAAALDGGEGAAWSAAMVRRAASRALLGLPRAYFWPADPDCHHFVLCRHSASGSARPR